MAENPPIMTPEGTATADMGAPSQPILKKLIPVIVILLFLGAETVAAYFTMNKIFFSHPPRPKTEGVTAADTSQKKPPTERTKNEESALELYQFQDLIVNPAGTLGRRLLVLSMSLEPSNKKVLEELKRKEPILRDALITLLSAKNLEYLADVLNREDIRREMLDSINLHLQEGKINRIFITSFIMQ